MKNTQQSHKYLFQLIDEDGSIMQSTCSATSEDEAEEKMAERWPGYTIILQGVLS